MNTGMKKEEIAAAFQEVAALMELAGEPASEIQAYSNAARAVHGLAEDPGRLLRERRLASMPGISPVLAREIELLLTTGRLNLLEGLRGRFPKTITELFELPGLGARHIKVLYEQLGVDSIERLREACEENHLTFLRGFGTKLQDQLLDTISHLPRHHGLHLFSKAIEIAQALLDYLKHEGSAAQLQLAGNLRRLNETTRDIVIVASGRQPDPLMQRFLAWPQIHEVTRRNETYAEAMLDSFIPAKLHVVPEPCFAFALLHYTGTSEHTGVLRHRAAQMGMKLSSQGLFRGDGVPIACETEADVYRALGLPRVPPELRENRGEFSVREFPTLPKPDDLKGLFHCHTTYSDGQHTVREMAAGARERGYRYILISDHSQSSKLSKGLAPARSLEQQHEIDVLNRTFTDFRILKGIEVDILPNGALDYDDLTLRTFDLVITSIHDSFDMTEPQATSRVVRAIENPYTAILGHPTGRLLLGRKGYPLDMEKVFDACVANSTAIEINAHPRRLDIDWRQIRRGKAKGVRFVIGTDAHRLDAIDCMFYGLNVARKGWLEAQDLLNCMTPEELFTWRRSR